ncbi:hypothetical protein [Streptomyces sp. NPDC056291]|uniref:hypothetical protein n=1 Tax=Streptomyces sp. NPDC056291 TaxID=3345772 RepID=UPI0035DF99C2
MSKYGDGIDEPYAHGGQVQVSVGVGYSAAFLTSISPDEARLLGLRLIKMADEAEAQEW